MKDKRQAEIMKLLLKEQTITTEALRAHFGISMETVRRDISAMEKMGFVKKVYGGIRLAADPFNMTSLENWNERLERCRSEKVRIAACALDLIRDGSVIALDIGTTIYELSRLLVAKHDLSVITNSLTIAGELARSSTHKVYCIGGVVIPNEIVTSGMFARQFLGNFASIDLFIGSADGITPERSITEYSEEVIEVKRQLIARAARHIALIDHSKFGKVGLFESCPLREIDVLITDDQAPQAAVDKLRKAGVEVIVAP